MNTDSKAFALFWQLYHKNKDFIVLLMKILQMERLDFLMIMSGIK